MATSTIFWAIWSHIWISSCFAHFLGVRIGPASRVPDMRFARVFDRLVRLWLSSFLIYASVLLLSVCSWSWPLSCGFVRNFLAHSSVLSTSLNARLGSLLSSIYYMLRLVVWYFSLWVMLVATVVVPALSVSHIPLFFLFTSFSLLLLFVDYLPIIESLVLYLFLIYYLLPSKLGFEKQEMNGIS